VDFEIHSIARHFRKRTIRFVLALSLVALAVVLILFLPEWLSPKRRIEREKKAAVAKNDQNRYLNDIEASDFESHIARFGARSLMHYVPDLNLGENDSLVVKLDKLKKQILIAQRIFILTQEQELQEYATGLNLEALNTRELLLIENDMIDAQATAELAQFVEDNRAECSRLFPENTALASATVAVSRFLGEDSPEIRVQLGEAAEAVFESVAKQSPIRVEMAERLLKLIRLVQAKGAHSVGTRFIQSFVARFENSEVAGVDNLVTEVQLSLAKHDERFADPLDSIQSERDAAIELLLTQVEKVFSTGSVRSELAATAIHRAIDLTRLGKLSAAEQTAEVLAKTQSLSKLHREQLTKLQKRITAMKRPFEISGLQDRNGDPAALDVDSNIFVFVFVDEDSYPASIELVRSVAAKFRRSSSSAGIQIKLVYLSKANDFNTIEDNPDLPLLILNAREQESSRQFMQRVPIDEIPMIAIVKRNPTNSDQTFITHFNPPVDFLDEFVTD
jgi:hypothetical protein